MSQSVSLPFARKVNSLFFARFNIVKFIKCSLYDTICLVDPFALTVLFIKEECYIKEMKIYSFKYGEI